MVKLPYITLLLYGNVTIKHVLENMVTFIYEEWLYGNLIIVHVTICRHMVIKWLPYDIFGLPYDINLGDYRPQCM